MSYLEQEIAEQPQVVAQLLDLEGEHAREIARAIQRRAPAFVVIAARGTSGHAATYGKYLLASTCGLPVALAAPSLYTIYHTPPRLQGALVIGISQSGHSPDIVEVVAEARRQGAMTLSITNDPQSPLGREAECCLPCHAGQERSVAATKTYTAQLTALALVGAALAGGDAMWAELQRLPEWLARVLQLAPEMQQRVERYRYMEQCVLIGRGYNCATAFEIALKLKELTYVVAEPYSSASFRHGPIAIVEPGFPVLMVAPQGAVSSDLLALAGELREREAELVMISDQAEALALAQTPLALPEAVPEWLSPVAAVVPGQLFAAALTRAKGYDLDRPRGLHKVTRTR
ncbi:MAG TPA: SIS domain-containing protein [Anaerolineae bacterium]|nr:SIS domain-containing protein [Anaerolineae bacterium]HOQ98847.1 SIS domain-containing protein [Anaerolineae bacterium]HPL27071.1 SIS domain-containing protein [Anaerolineae bacterium]